MDNTSSTAVRLINTLSVQDSVKVRSAYMAIARHFVDTMYTDTYKVTMMKHLSNLNELVIIDMDTIKSMIIEYVEFKRYWSQTYPYSKASDFSSSLGIDFVFNKTYTENVDKEIDTYNNTYQLMRMLYPNKER